MKHLIRIFVLICFLTNKSGFAQCSDVFTSAVSSHSVSGSLFLGSDADVRGSGTVIDVPSIVQEDPSDNTCFTAPCQSSGNTSRRLSLAPFETSSSTNDIVILSDRVRVLPVGNYRHITVGNGATLIFSGTGVSRIGRLTASIGSTVEFTSDTYWIEEMEIGNESTVQLSSNEFTQINANTINSGNDVEYNLARPSGSLFLVAYSTASFGNQTNFNGYIYGDSTVFIDRETSIKGAVTGTDITMNRRARVSFDDFGINRLDEYRVCGGPLPEQVAFYQFEEFEFSGANSIQDASGTNNDGSPIGDVSSIFPTNDIACRAVDIAKDNLSGSRTAEINNAVDTQLDVNELGQSGTISFWYRSNEAWDSGNPRQLFDATLVEDEENPVETDKYFFASILGNGSIRFAYEDTEDGDYIATTRVQTFAEGEWVHLAFTWNASSRTAAVYVNGVNRINATFTDFTSSRLADLSTLYIGDNRSTLFRSGASSQSANGQFDSVRVYRNQQTPSEVIDDLNSNEACAPLTFYRIEHPSVGLTCEASQVRVTACVDESCSFFAEPVSISFPTNTGVREEFSFTGSRTINVRNSADTSLVLDVIAQNVTSTPLLDAQCSSDCEIEFRNAAFQFVDQANGLSTLLPDIVAESSLSRIGIRAAEDNDGVCVSALSGVQDVTLSFDCIAGGTSYSPNICRQAFSGLPADPSNTGKNRGTLSLDFGNDGIADLPGVYADAGRLSLQASGEYDDFSINSGDGVMFDSYPASVLLVANEEALAEGSNTFVAGASFSFSIAALGDRGNELPGYQPGHLAYNLRRTIHDGSLASGLESVLSFGSDTNLRSVFSSSFQSVPNRLNFTNGQYRTASAQNSEVGTYSLTLRDTNYLGNRVEANSLILGRFIPAFFDIVSNTPVVAPNCSGNFSYMGLANRFELGLEPEYTVTAFNANRQITQLYSADEWRLAADTLPLASLVGALDTSTTEVNGNLLSVSVDTSTGNTFISNTANFNGSGEILISNLGLTYEKPDLFDTQLAPFDTDVQLSIASSFFTDSDGVCYRPNYINEANVGSCQPFNINNIGGAEQRYGRLRLLNTYGPETRPLRVPIQTEYLNRGNWLVNSEDSCTNIDFTQASGQLVLSNASSAFESNIVNQYRNITSAGTLNNGMSSGSDLLFNEPAGNERGSVRISLDPNHASAHWAQYLNVDWNEDGTLERSEDFPSAVVSFGLFRGNDRIFHSREVLRQD